MDNLVTITLMFINGPVQERMHFELERLKYEFSEHWCKASHLVDILVIILLISMPRERGRPRRGTTWYDFDARQKRQQKLER
jgi:hypothetical protein